MRYLSVCSGIEAATVAWHDMGWQPVGFADIEAFPSAVLAHHYPTVPNYGDMTTFKEWDIGAIDLLVGGTPCQSFSVAGLRKGMADPRGNLALTYCGILDHFKPKWFVWENVPGVLSSAGGRDFGSFLGAVGKIGYGFAYRVLDAQWFGVAQRRRRVFVVGCLGDWRSAAEVLFESESLRWDLAPSREKGQAVAPTVVQGPPYSRTGNERVECDAIVPQSVMATLNATDGDKWGSNQWVDEGKAILHPTPIFVSTYSTPAIGNIVQDEVSSTMTKNTGSGGETQNPAFVVQPIPIHDQATRHAGKRGDNQDGKGNGFGVGQPGDPANTLTKGDRHAVAQPMAFTTEQTPKFNQNQALTLTKQSPTGGGQPQAVMTNMAVRRLTPTECERLQGFSDGYTNIPWRKKEEAPDSLRYKALGNSMAVPVMKWIGNRINNMEQL